MNARKKIHTYLIGYGHLEENIPFVVSEDVHLHTDNKNIQYKMDEIFNRCSNRNIQIDGLGHMLCMDLKTYKNRHLIFPTEAKKNNFYKIDICAKTKIHRGEWIELLGWKWITKAKRITWRCRLLSNGKIVYTYFIDATTCKSSNDLSFTFSKLALTNDNVINE